MMSITAPNIHSFLIFHHQRYDQEKQATGRAGKFGGGKGKEKKTGNNPLLDELNNDGPSLADLRQAQLNEQKSRNDKEYSDLDPITRMHLQGYSFSFFISFKCLFYFIIIFGKELIEF